MSKRSAQRAGLHRVFVVDLVRPTRKIIEIDAMIIVAEKRTWAETPSGRRHLVGTSAFYTLQSAERAKRGALVKIVQTHFLGRNPTTMYLYSRAERLLAHYDASGTFDDKRKVN